MARKITQRDIILEFYKQNPNRDILHPEIVDWAIMEYTKRTGKTFRDPDRQIRRLHQEGILVKVKYGVYRYDPQQTRKLTDFTPTQRAEILKRDGYKCVVCGLGEKEGMVLHADHVKPKDKGGESTISNGQTLCSAHNFKKKNYNQTETAKKLFVNLLNRSKDVKDATMMEFCKDILRVYDEHDINGHIDWKK